MAKKKKEKTDTVEAKDIQDKVEPSILDFKGIVRGPKLVTKQGRVMIDLGIIDSPSLATGIALAVNKTALEVKQLKSLTEWAVRLQLIYNDYAEKMKMCDCPVCQAKAYVESQLGKGSADAPAHGIGGHYL